MQKGREALEHEQVCAEGHCRYHRRVLRERIFVSPPTMRLGTILRDRLDGFRLHSRQHRSNWKADLAAIQSTLMDVPKHGRTWIDIAKEMMWGTRNMLPPRAAAQVEALVS